MRSRDALAVATLVAAAAVLRFATIDVQSYWHDEALTASLLRMPLGDMLSQLPHNELTPPLYYLLAWPWVRLFGHLELALRSLSALAGVATVPVAYLAARELASRRVAIAAAALVAFNPLLVWYSQEARPYSLLVLLGALSALFFGRALNRRRERDLALWALASILALLTHYFAAFLILPEALWLARVWRPRSRALVAAAAVAVVAIALVPLAAEEHANISSDYIGSISLRRRLLGVPEDFLTGFVIKWDTTKEKVLDAVALALGALGVWLAFARGERRAVWAGTAGALAAAGVPALLAVVGVDFLNTRNVLLGVLPALLVVAAGYAAQRNARVLAVGGVAALCAVGVASVAITQADPTFHRSDWRGAARALGPVHAPRVLAVPAVVGPVDMSIYLDRLSPLPAAGARVAEVDALTPRNSRLGAGASARPAHLLPPTPRFHLVERLYEDGFTLVRFRAPVPELVTPADAARAGRGVVAGPAVLVQRPG